MDDLNLSQDQTEKILQFQDLTGIENLAVCRDALQRHGWDLEVAVQDQLNISEGRPSLYASEHTAPTVVNDGIVQHVFYSPPSGSYRWGGPFGYFVTFVFQFCYNTLTSILKFAFSLFWKDTRRAVTDPVGDVLKFIDHFNEAYGRNHPVFYQGSYSQALNDAKQELKFLLIYLHQENNQDCTSFCRETLANAEVINYINNNVLMWACTMNSGEGYAVSQTLRAGGFPFLAMIVLKESRMTLVGRLEGPTNCIELMSRLGAIVSSNVSYLDTARSERIARSLTQTIRREQDVAYMESLRADQEKERRKCEEEERKRRLEEEERNRQLKEQLRKEAIRKAKVEMASEVPSEPEAVHPEAVCVVFKMPSGERLERRFLRSHTLKDIYNYVFCHPTSPDCFEIATNFPKRILQCETEADKTLLEAGLGKSEVLFVYDLEA
ncbi:unnamed protein product [Nezara viridula]|uniref:UBX domain-containing protein n=1 Tax=Nezara viridula TaxID=85310 RepID=A0A9P0HQV9_NEZVI|nr:unnamed protein product [Nezara viridula]